MINIEKAESSNVDGVVAIHRQAFPGFFLTTLGNRFLRLYYKCMIKNSDAITLCAIDDGKILGFATTAVNSAGFNLRLIRENVFGFMWECLILVLTRPMSLIHLAKNMSKNNSKFDDTCNYAELFSIGVSPDRQGKGIGGMLLAETERILVSKKVKRISLTTDKYENESTIAFYQLNGYEVMYEFRTYPNREMIRFIKDI